jgi:uncharacterized protein YecT (DUF1311 family)
MEENLYMKRNMTVIFIVAVLFIVSVGLVGVIKGNHGLGNNSSNKNYVPDKEAVTKEEKEQDVQTKITEIPSEDTKISEQKPDNSIYEIKIEEDSEKEQYITRLDSIVTYYQELWNNSGSLDMTSMKELKNQEYTKWDDELNTIYQLIKKKLPEEEFVLIREQERQWITNRDEKSELAASKYAGGTMEGLEYMAVMTELTRERTYELVTIYFEE